MAKRSDDVGAGLVPAPETASETAPETASEPIPPGHCRVFIKPGSKLAERGWMDSQTHLRVTREPQIVPEHLVGSGCYRETDVIVEECDGHITD